MESIAILISVDDDHVIYSFDIMPGYYAIALFHDENYNEICGANFLGIPQEGFAFSNNYKPFLRSPAFEDCEILIRKDTTIYINLIFK